jgi:hypothetical protein
MMFNVPQFIDVEDKIAGPLTWKQILWMIGMGAALLTLYNIVDATLFFILAIPVIIIFSLFAFYRPSGMSMITFSMHAFLFLFEPKVSVWERPVAQGPLPRATEDEGKNTAEATPHKTFNAKQAHELASLIDGRK